MNKAVIPAGSDDCKMKKLIDQKISSVLFLIGFPTIDQNMCRKDD